MQSIEAKNDLGPCAGCGVNMERGEWVVFRNTGTTHAGCFPRETVGSGQVNQTHHSALLFPDDRPQQVITTAKETLGTSTIRFDGETYDPKFDQVRLAGQILKTFNCMRDGVWRTIDEIHELTNVPHTSVSAQLRHLRKEKFGHHQVDRRSRGNRANGLFEYRLLVREPERAA